MTIRNLNNDQIVGAALRGEDAETHTGNMCTMRVTASNHPFGLWKGNMPKVWAGVFGERVRNGLVSQVIYSYDTPIAWLDSEFGWVVPIVRYSTTTSNKHQTHLWKLGGRHIYLPWDATAEDAERVMTGKMVFNGDRNTHPGPNYVAGE